MTESEDASFERLLEFLQQQRGFDYTGYKRPSLMRRVARRMQLAGVESFDGYIEYLEVHPEEFVQLFSDLLERSYISKIELYGGERIQFTGEALEAENAIVRTRLLAKQGTEIPIDYRMLRKGDKWLVYDVVIEGVSLIANYRTQFNKIITTSSYQELVKKMKTKQGEFLEEEKKRTSMR